MENICINELPYWDIEKWSIPRLYTNTRIHTHTTRSAFLTSFISLLGTDLMIFPVEHKYFISVMYDPATFCLCLKHKHNFETQGQAA